MRLPSGMFQSACGVFDSLTLSKLAVGSKRQCLFYFLRPSLPLTESVSRSQPCPTFCHSMDCSPPGSSVHGILQAGIPEWVAIFFSRESSRPREGLNPGLPHYRQIIYHLSHQGSHIVLFKGNETCFRSKTPEHLPKRGNALDVDAQSQ